MDEPTKTVGSIEFGPAMLKTFDVMRILRISRGTLFRYIDAGLPVHRLSPRVIRFDADEVQAWVRNRCSDPAAGQDDDEDVA